ncbi:MAG: hypothetical protein P1U38_15980 [Aeromicrobium sp.]|uniref:ZIP family metal transporter n=1 Tax=Aeromicrobium sp. TaxID=1871063 RepID=UPI002618E2EE|nr:hypothetical protein [Aeromicrobium sp.]MDF1706268.1 hypothetical protein [Aeromicrobium sp.]
MAMAFWFGVATAVPLVIGAAVGLRWHLPTPVLAVLMAFGAGTLTAAASEELFGPAFESEGVLLAGAALLLGAGVYVGASHLLDTRLGAAAAGPALLLGAVLDGIPENLALGVGLVEGGSIVLLVAIIVGNVPEAVSSGALLGRSNFGPARALALWVVTGVVLVACTVGAYAASDAMGGTSIALVQAFAGGATVAVLADTLFPEAYREGGWWVGLATAAGFLTAFGLG